MDELGRISVRVLFVTAEARMRIGVLLHSVAVVFAVHAVSACADSGAQGAAAGKQVRAAGYSDGGDSLRLLTHDENLPAGFPLSGQPLVLRNPHEGDKAAMAVGAQLFVAYNCIDCHGADGAGAMGPSFQDGRWHFGGSAGAVFESIYQGRPDGMPSWGGRISNDQIWMLTTYVRSLAKSDISTENFTSETVERTGH
jgi:mono/diheme cytochrome c family protein